LFCGHGTRLFIPRTLFLFSYPLEQLEFIRFSNFPGEVAFAFVPVTRPRRLILPRDLSNVDRRHRSGVTV
jgi:hypothetical protein